MNENEPTTRDESSKSKFESLPSGKRLGLVAIAAAVMFLAGFVPMWLKAANQDAQLEAAQRALQLAEIQLALGSAAVDARRGEYEQARQAAVTFFKNVTSEMDREESAFTPAQRNALKSVLKQRDELITLLARGDPASADRLSDLYVAYRAAASSTRAVSMTNSAPAAP